MSTTPQEPTQQAGGREQRAKRGFAAVEQIGVRAGVALTVIAFVLYVGGIVKPYLSIHELIASWGLPSGDLIAHTGLPTGWDWVGLLGNSDMLALGGLTLLASVVIVAYAAMLVAWIREGNLPYLVLTAIQLAVFLLAASGVLGGGR